MNNWGILKNSLHRWLMRMNRARFYRIEGTIVRMLAPCGRNFRQYQHDLFGCAYLSECWTFREEHGRILIPWGGEWGIFMSALRRSAAALRNTDLFSAGEFKRLRSSIKVYPKWLDVGKGPCESMKEGNEPEMFFEVVVGGARRLFFDYIENKPIRRQLFFDCIEDRPFECVVEVDNEAIDEEKLVRFIKTLQHAPPERRG